MSSRILFPCSFAFPSDEVGREGVSRLSAKSGGFPARPSRNPIPAGRSRSSEATPDGPTASPLPLQGVFPREAQKASPTPRQTRKVRRKVQQPRCTPPVPGDRTPPAPLFPPRDAAARRKESLRAAQDRTKPGEGAEKAPLEVSMTRRDFRRKAHGRRRNFHLGESARCLRLLKIRRRFAVIRAGCSFFFFLFVHENLRHFADSPPDGTS